MTTEAYKQNLPFICRELLRSEIFLLSGAESLQKGRFCYCPTASLAPPRKAVLAILPTGSEVKLADFLSFVKDEYVGIGLGFPLVLTPEGEVIAQHLVTELIEYFIVYDFVERKRDVLVQVKSPQFRERKEILVSRSEVEGLPEKLAQDLREAVMEECASEASEWWEILACLADQRLTLFLATLNGEPVGCAVCLRYGSLTRILLIYTAKDFRGRGVGECLVSEVVRYSVSNQSLLTLSALPCGSPLIYYLGKFGFRNLFSYSIWYPPCPEFFKEP